MWRTLSRHCRGRAGFTWLVFLCCLTFTPRTIATENSELLRVAALSTALAQDVAIAGVPEAPVILFAADRLLRKGLSESEVRTWLAQTSGLAQRARQQLQLYERDRVTTLSDSATLVASIKSQAGLQHVEEFVASARDLGAIRIGSMELCKVQRCDPRTLARIPQLAEQVRAIAVQMDDNDALRRIAIDYFRANGLSQMARVTNAAADVEQVLATFESNRYVQKLLENLPTDGTFAAQLPKRFESVLDTYAHDIASVSEDFRERVNRINDVETGLQFAGQLAGLVDPKVGSTISQIANAWTQVERARNAFSAASNLANAFAMANSYVFAAQVGISLLNGGDPLGGGGGDQEVIDAMRGYFEAVFDALQQMTEYMTHRFDAIDTRLTEISKQLSAIQDRLLTIEYKLDQVAATATAIRNSVQEVHHRIDALESLIIGAAQLVVDFQYRATRDKCFREIGSSAVADVIGCLSTLKTYGVDHANGLFALDRQAESGRAASYDLLLRPSASPSLKAALDESGYDLNTLINGGTSYTDYAALVLANSASIPDATKQSILADLQSFEAALLARQLVYRSFLWDPIAALRLSASLSGPSTEASAVTYRRFGYAFHNDELLRALSVTRLFVAYVNMINEIANAGPEDYRSFQSNSGNYDYYDYENGTTVTFDGWLFQFCEKANGMEELTAVSRQFRQEVRDAFLSKFSSPLKVKSRQIRVVRDVLVDGHAELLLGMNAAEQRRVKEFVYQPASVEGLADAIEGFVDEVACRELDRNEYWDRRLGELRNQLHSMAAIEPAAIDSLQFRDRRIGPLLRRIQSVRAYLELSAAR